MTLALDDNFLNDVGLGNATPEQKQALVQRLLETLELRVGTRLAEELSEEQVDEFETMTPAESDPQEIVVQKQQLLEEWLKANHPNHEDVIAEELEILKQELKSGLDSVMDSSAVQRFSLHICYNCS